MIRIRDALTLARTKLRARPILLGVTVLVASLLFGILYGASFILTGVESSIRSFEQETHDGKYLVSTSPVLPSNQDLYDYPMRPNIKADLEQLHDRYIKEQRQLSKELNVPFDEKVIVPPFRPYFLQDPNLPADEQQIANYESPVISEYLRLRAIAYADKAKNTKTDLIETASRYNMSAVYQPNNALVMYSNTHYLPEGKENLQYLLKQDGYTGSANIYDSYKYAVRNSEFQILDIDLLKNWLLPENEKRRNASAIPLVITTDEAVALFGKELGIEKQPEQPSEYVAWIRNLREKINGHTFTSCYRNSADRQRLTEAMRTLSDIAEHKNDNDYAPPKVIYNLPTEPCGDVTVKSDVRTAAEKRVDQNQATLERRLALAEDPQRRLLTFQIAGIMQAPKDVSRLQSIEDFANSLFSLQMNGGAFIPKQLYEMLPENVKNADILFNSSDSQMAEYDVYNEKGITSQIVAFNTVADARAFMKNEGCNDYSPNCKKLFYLTPYGSNYLLLDDMRSFVQKALRIALPAALAIAAIIIFLTIARIIIDSRRETAVYRAIGAKRSDIMAVYLLYSGMVALLTILLSIGIGAALALVAQHLYGTPFTHQAHVAFGLFDTATAFAFVGVNWQHVALFTASIIGVSIIATLPPLIRNVRRSPIADMRDE